MSKKSVQKAIDYWLETGDNSLLVNETLYLEETWKTQSKGEGDFRPGVETYGYVDDKSIRNNMEYISDRWLCAFRIRWILDGLENGRI